MFTKNKIGYILLCCWMTMLLIFPHQSIQAQNDLHRMKFDHIDIMSHNLSQNSIFKIVQDHEGFLWFSTQNGLNKFDGYRFQVYKSNRKDPNSLSDNWINTLYIDKAGVLWVGTLNGGVNKYDAKNDSFKQYTQQQGLISSNTISHIVEDNNGFIWIGTDNGLNRLDPKTDEVKVYHHDSSNSKGISSDNIIDLFIDRDGLLWIATEDAGVDRFNPQTEEIVNYRNIPGANSLSDNYVAFIYQDSGGRYWFGTDHGLDQFDLATATFKNFRNDPNKPNSLSNDQVQYIYEDREQRLWIGTNQGLNLFLPQEEQFIRYLHNSTNTYSLSDDNIRSIYQDDSGILWVGTNSSGINKYSKEQDKFEHFYNEPTNPNSLDNNSVWSFYTDKSNQLWVGTSAGLNIYDPSLQQVKHYQHDAEDEDSISAGSVWEIFGDSSGAIWIGTQTGLDRFDQQTGRFIHYRYDSSNGNLLVNIRVLFEDKQGILWIGTKMNGLFSLDQTRSTFSQLASPTLNQTSWITSLAEDRNDRLWIGTNTGLYQLDVGTGAMVAYKSDTTAQNHISHDRIRSIYQDAGGMIWIATAGGGLNRLNVETQTFTAWTEDDGLSNNAVYGILPDDQGNLWLSTDLGISKFDPQQNKFRNYDIRNGLQSNEYNGNAYYRSSSGEMFFGGINGFNAFYPSEIKESSYIPPVRIISFNTKDQAFKFNDPFCCSEPLRLTYRDNSFSVEFVSLDFSMPQKNEYAYKLEGFDNDWVYSGNRRFASYTNLGAGNYTLRVKGTNTDGIWSNKEVSIDIHVGLPFWKTWWAYSLYAICLAFLFWGYNRFRLKIHERKLKAQQVINEELLKMNRLKDDILATTTHELKTPLHGIIGITESILDGVGGSLNEMMRKNLKIVISNARRLNTLVNNILDFSKIKQSEIQLHVKPVDISVLMENICVMVRPLIFAKHIVLENKIISPVYVNGDEDRIQQILFNLIGNAVKFTESGRIEIAAQTQDQRVEISVSDTGIGIPPDKFNSIFEPFEQVNGSISREYGGTGLGLAITKHLIQLHNGSIQVESVVGEGSKFIVTLPMAATPTHTVIEDRAYIAAGQDEWAVANENQSNATIRILAVDDDPVNLQVIVNYLAMQNWSIVVARDGFEALSLVENESIDLILLDVMMPRMSGFETCKKIREAYQKEELPIIFLTAKNTPDDFAAGFEAGGNDYLTKPFTKYELVSRVMGHLKLKLMVVENQKNSFTKIEKEILSLAYRYPRRELLTRYNEQREHSIVEKTLENHISKILRKLGIEGEGIEKGAQLAKKKGII